MAPRTAAADRGRGSTGRHAPQNWNRFQQRGNVWLSGVHILGWQQAEQPNVAYPWPGVCPMADSVGDKSLDQWE